MSTDTIATQKDVNRWPHLSGIEIPSVDTEIGFLIGSDAPQALGPTEIKQSKDDGPFAMRIAIGWVLNGPMGRTGPDVTIANIIGTNAELSK